MLQIIVGTIIAFLSVAGIAELVRCVQEFFLMTPQDRITFMVASRGHDEKIEYILRSLIFKTRSLHLKVSPIIIVVDEGMDAETKAICEKLSGEYGSIRICASQELAAMFCGEKGLTS
jgi:hypothetical protein